MKFGDGPVKKYDRSSLRVLGSVGEPISPAAWEWYYRVVGDSKCSIVDTYWQTETGGIVMSPLPGATPMKPGSCTLPLPGIQPVLLDEKTGKPLTGNNVKGVLAFAKAWPGIARSIQGDHGRFIETYMKPYPGYYFTGDGAFRDSDGYYWSIGRVDDVLNVAGHRLGTAELEAAFVQHAAAAEAAVVGIPQDVKGTGIVAFVVLKQEYEPSKEITEALRAIVRQVVSPIATPDAVYLVNALPKTRSGKVMRRILRKLASGERRKAELGDTSTLAEPQVVDDIIKVIDSGKIKANL
jgi:acetyl-CoA synthetase